MADKLKVFAIAGSIRNGSFNRAALEAAKELAPDDMEIDIHEIDGFPGFDQDKEKDPPQKVTDMKAAIKAADAILVATPEYNYSVPGILKNVIDWVSRPYGENAFAGKPGAIMGASPGGFGTVRAQMHLRQIFLTLDVKLINKPEILIANCGDRFDDDLKLTDEDTRKMIRKMLETLGEWTRQLSK